MTNRRRVLALMVWAAGAAGCMNGPFNGSVYDGDGGTTSQQQVGLYGFFTTPNHQVRVLVLKSPTLDPNNDANWTEVPGSPVYTGTQQYFYNDPNTPMYLWQLNVTTPGSYAGAWANGGLARVRAIATTPGLKGYSIDARLTAFDDDFNDCLNANNGQSWETIRNNCKTLESANFDTATLVSAVVKPSATQTQQAQSPYLSRPAGAGEDDNVGKNYYHANGIDVLFPSLTAFKNHYGFGIGSPSEIAAVYYNGGDLGLGREMHCMASGAAKVCYVTNYADRVPPGSDPTKRIFGGTQANVNDALAKAVAGFQGQGGDPVATVAMIDPGNGGAVQFMVFDGQGVLSPKAILDASAHPNTQVPSNCMTCHAASGSFFDGKNVNNAHFLPFDLDLFQFSGQAGFTESDQLDKLRALNAIVFDSQQTSVAKDLLKGWYPPNGPDTSGPTFNGGYVPANWQSQEYTRVYNFGIKKYCRTCHLTQISDWSSPTQLVNLESSNHTVTNYLCDQHVMPQALVTQNNFWNSSARAHLLGFLGAHRDCAP